MPNCPRCHVYTNYYTIFTSICPICGYRPTQCEQGCKVNLWNSVICVLNIKRYINFIKNSL